MSDGRELLTDFLIDIEVKIRRLEFVLEISTPGTYINGDGWNLKQAMSGTLVRMATPTLIVY